MVTADPLTGADDAEARLPVEVEACRVLREHPRLDRPDPGRLRRSDQLLQQCPRHTEAARFRAYVDGVLDDSKA